MVSRGIWDGAPQGEWDVNRIVMADLVTQILFYEDTSAVRDFQEKFKIYEDKFPPCPSPNKSLQLPVMYSY